jgi:hypothetical protein
MPQKDNATNAMQVVRLAAPLVRLAVDVHQLEHVKAIARLGVSPAHALQ